ncbi:MAG: methionyl-tRNA formyltransferase [Alphaproteobacteria bacterium]|nr:methionyl-tRNA formyltransferase [Alphaproteobacteria bacterium]
MRAIVIGAVESSLVALEAIARTSGWTLPLVISLPRDLEARHSDFVALSGPARAAGAEFLMTSNINRPETIDIIRATDADYVFVIGWSQICGADFRAATGDRVIGYHPAPLPRMRGRGVIPWTILANEPITAGTLFWIDEGTDSGPILKQVFFHVSSDETAASLYARHVAVLAGMMDSALASLTTSAPPRLPQDARYATWAARRRPEDGIIDWTQSSADICRLIRAVGKPYPGARSHIADKQVILWHAEPWAGAEHHLALPGQVIGRDANSFVIMCGCRTALRVTEWDYAGGGIPTMHARLGLERGEHA